MKARDTVPFRVRKPPEWDRFIEAVADEHRGYTSPYAGLAIERTWNQYREVHRAEDLANRLLDAAGLPRGADREKNPPTRDSAGAPGRTSVRVLREVRDEMAAEADEMDVPLHEVLRAVVCWYLDGGRMARVTDKLAEAVPEVEAMAARDRGDPDGESVVERRTRRVCQALTDLKRIREDQLQAVIEDVAGVRSPPSIRRYIDLVVDRLDLTETKSPGGTVVYVSKTDVDRQERATAEADAALDALQAVTDGGRSSVTD